MKVIITILILFAARISAGAQIQFTAAIPHTTATPSGTPSASGARLRFDLSTYRIYEWSPTAVDWIPLAQGLDPVAGAAAPSYTPTEGQSQFAINDDHEVYRHTGGGSWVQINAGDNWGSQSVAHGSTLSGNGTGGSPLDVADGGITNVKVSTGIDAAKIADGSVSNSEFQFINSVTSNVQTQIDGKAASSHTHGSGDITDLTEAVQDVTGGMVTGNTETLISVTYQDGDGTLDFAVEPNLSNYTNDAGFLTAEVDGSTTNEIQNLSYTASTGAIGITGGTGTTIVPMQPSSPISNGEQGLVPKPFIGDEILFLRGDATWASAGDNWGSAVVEHGSTLTGNGTSGSPLDVADGGITNIKVATGIDAAKIADGSVSNTEFQRLDGVTSGIQTQLNAKAASGANTDITSVYLNNTGLKVKDTDASHGLSIVPGSNLTADRTLTVTTGDADRTLTMNASTTLGGGTHSGTNTGDVALAGTPDYITISGQTITRNAVDLATDVTGELPTANIANGAVTMAKINQASASSGQVIKWNGSAWAPAADGGSTFISLSDAPSSYSGQGGKVVAVNSGATALEFLATSSLTIPGVQSVLVNDEASSSTISNSSAESAALKTYSLQANNYTSIVVEALVDCRDDPDANNKIDYTWRIKLAGATQETFAPRIIASSTTSIDGGGRYIALLRTTFAGGQGGPNDVTITVQMSAASASISATVVGWRVYGVKDYSFPVIGGTSNGDKGDITVSGTGDAWAIDAGAVTFAKMQTVSANILLGNDASGTAVEEIACTSAGRALIDDADATAQRTTLGLGSIATQVASSVSITGGSITGITDLAVADGGTGAGDAATARTNLGAAATSGNLSQFAATTSAQLAGVLSDETGTGLVVFATNPALTTPNIGTPSAGTLTNCSGLPATGITQGGASTGQVMSWDGSAWAAQSLGTGLVSINAQTGTTYTLVIGDAGKLITMSNAAANTLTIPPNSSVAFPVGTIINITQTGAGQTTIAPGSGVTIQSADTKTKLRVQYSSCSIIKTATDTWILIGDIAA